ncbi:MAG: SPL family radical SAM protein [Desulfurococcaceae archaeon]
MLELRFRGLVVYYARVKSGLSKSGLPDIEYALNPYLGCGHGCVYCYARLYTRDERASKNWGSVVVVKVNLPSVLEDEVKRLKPGVVGVGTITDAYQPVEAVYKITRKSIEVLLRHGFPVSIQTKNPLVLRDLDVLASYKKLVDVGFTITTLRSEVAKNIEPKAPPPAARAEALKKLSKAGIKTWVFYGPIIPGLNDDYATAKSVAELASETGSVLYYDPLRVKPFMHSPGHPLKAAAEQATSFEWLRRVRSMVLELCREYGLTCRPGFAGDAAGE